MTSFDNLSFITNNVKGIQSIKKRLKLTVYFKSKITTHGILFFQETHTPVAMTNKNGEIILAAIPTFHTAKETHVAF